MKQLSKQETKELEYSSTPMINIMAPCQDELAYKWFDVIGWTHNGRHYAHPKSRNITNQAMHKTVAEMSKLIGFKQNYHITWSIRNAVWGLQIDDIKFVLYISTEGTSVQIDQNCTETDVEKIVNQLYGILINDFN